jgi:putative ABC transport system permease protein
MKDLLFTLRRMRKSPAFTAIAILTLALGIGANTAIFNLLDAIVLRPLPIPHPEQLVALGTTIPDDVNGDQPFSLRMFEEISRQRQLFSQLFGYERSGITNFDAAGAHHAAELATVSGGYYPTLQISPFLGRFFNDGDVATDSGNSPAIAVISYRAWQAWYRADPSIVGRTLRIEQQPFIIIGVEPQSFSGLIIDEPADVTIPMFSLTQADSTHLRDPRLLWLRLYGRLHPEMSFAQACAQLETMWPHIRDATRPPGYEGARLARFSARGIHMEPATSGVSDLRKKFSSSLFVLQGLVGAVLLAMCLNLTNLSLARAINQQHESGVRAALGAGFWVLIRQPIIESCLLCLTGSLLGLLLAYWASRALLAIAWTGVVSMPLSVNPDWRVILFTAAVATLAALLVAVAPAWYSARMDPLEALKRRARSIRGESAFFGKALLAAQISVSLVLVTSALLFAKTLSGLLHTDAGYRRDHLLTILLFPQSKTGASHDTSGYYRELSDKLRRLPGVEAVSFSVNGPANGNEPLWPVSTSPGQPAVQAVEDFVGPDFFKTLGMHVLSGREFTWDDNLHGPDAAILSRSLAERLFGKADPIGRFVYSGASVYAQKSRVVGVVNSASIWRVESFRPMALYHRLADKYDDAECLADIRTLVDPYAIKTSAGRIVRSLGREYPLRTMTVEERLNSTLTVQRLTALLAGFFGVVALLIAAIGIYGLISFHVSKRTAEMGVRAALGARRGQLLTLVMREVLLLVTFGCIAGLLASAWTGRLIANLLFGTSATNPVLLASAVLALVCVAVIAGFLPARRAAQMDPMNALRAE